MAKRLTVFYSWQSDSPSSLNRNFIEKALQEALERLHSDASLENALRDTLVELDKDTKGVAGSPPIAETILQKIEGCAVFVADITFVGQSKEGMKNAAGKPRQFPNPNVLIEYGYALRCHTHRKLIGVMNTAFGKPDSESLPFDLRHLRWPITYHLVETTSCDKADQFEKLVGTQVDALGLILSSHSIAPKSVETFTPQKATKNPAIFSESSHELITDRSGEFVVPEGGKAYLRMYPKIAVNPIESELEAQEIAIKGNLQPLGRVSGWGFDRNEFGAIAFQTPENGKLFNFTQLFLSREIWGVDAESLNADRILQWPVNEKRPYIANTHLENCYVSALGNYLAFAQNHLKLPLPLHVEAGVVGVKGYPISLNAVHIGGKSLRDSISWHADVDSYEKPPWVILDPFFDRIWANCGIERTAQQRAELANRFAVRR